MQKAQVGKRSLLKILHEELFSHIQCCLTNMQLMQWGSSRNLGVIVQSYVSKREEKPMKKHLKCFQKTETMHHISSICLQNFQYRFLSFFFYISFTVFISSNNDGLSSICLQHFQHSFLFHCFVFFNPRIYFFQVVIDKFYCHQD